MACIPGAAEGFAQSVSHMRPGPFGRQPVLPRRDSRLTCGLRDGVEFQFNKSNVRLRRDTKAKRRAAHGHNYGEQA